MPFITRSEIGDFIKAVEGDEGPRDKETFNGAIYPPEVYKERYKGDKTYEECPANPQEMQCTWFYYFTMSENCELRFMEFQAYGNTEVSDDQIRSWIMEGRNSYSGTNSNILDISWNMPGYIIFCVDIPSWEILEDVPDGEKGNRSLYFAQIPGKNKGDPLAAYPNYSFYNAKTRRIGLGPEKLRITQVENHHFVAVSDPNSKDKYTPRKPDSHGNAPAEDAYKFDLYFLIKVEQDATDGNDIEDKYAVVVLDPGGKNTGP